MTDSRTIVVGVDGSKESEAALRWAVTQARPDDRVLAVLVRSGAESPPATASAIRLYGREPADRDAERLRATVQAAAVPDAMAAEQVVVTGDPAGELVKASSDAFLLVVGSHGARPIGELLLGSVATQCVRHARCPVVVMSPGAVRWDSALDRVAEPVMGTAGTQ